jgi:quercetin dioxygenase-like cupin family protein
MIGSTVFKWEDLKVHPTPNGERRDVANNPTPTMATFESHITTLNPGKASHEPHRHPQEELIIVKEGTLEVHINGHTQVAGPGSTFFYASNDAHAVRNVGDTRATYWVINLATSVTHNPAEYNRAPTLHSAVFDWQKLTVKPSKVGEGRAVLNGSTVTLKNLESHITTVNAGEAPHAAHRHPDEELILVREGTMEATINGQAQRAGPGSIFFFASNDLHGLRNVGTTRATYHVIRLVTPTTPIVAKAN